MHLSLRFQSIRSIVTSIILVLGLLSLAATLVTGQVYHSLTLRSQLENIEHQLYLESHKTLQRLKQFSLQLSTLVINDDEFKNSLGNKRELENYLSRLPTLPFMQSGVLNVGFVYVYDDRKNYLAGAKLNKKSSAQLQEKICSKETESAISVSYAGMTDVVYALCVNDKKPYLLARVPYTKNNHHGYIELISDFSKNIIQLDNVINFPIRLRFTDNAVQFVSDSWPSRYSDSEIATHAIKDDAGKEIIFIDALHIDSNLDSALSNAQLLVISGAIIVILISVLTSFYVLQRTVINPVNEVVSSLRLVRDNRANLGAQVKSRGADEIIKLMDDFNAMSTALNQLYETLEKMTFTDPLTRLGNRKLFHEKLQQQFDLAEIIDARFALLLIDLDKFKQVNDTYGHVIGDKLLVETSNRFSEVVRKSRFVTDQTGETLSTPVQDILTRLGGDEFALVLPGVTEKEEVIELARSLYSAIHEPMILDGHTIHFGLSIGIAFYPDHATSQEVLIRCADEAMYQSKSASSNYSIFNKDNASKAS